MGDERKNSIPAKLVEIMLALDKRVPKRGRNTNQGYDYAMEADTVELVRVEIASRKLVLMPAVVDIRHRGVGEKGQVVSNLVMEMTWVDAETNDTWQTPWIGSGMDGGDKGEYKAITGAVKYFLLKQFLLPTGDDPERDERPSRAKPEPKPDVPESSKASDPIGPAGHRKIRGTMKAHSVGEKEVKDYIKNLWGYESTKNILNGQLPKVVEFIERGGSPEAKPEDLSAEEVFG